MTAVGKLADFRALDPFFRIIEEGVAGLVDGEHFFDLLAEDVVFEYVITVPGYPRRPRPASGCPVPGVAAGATRPMTTWQLNRQRLAAVIAVVAPGIPIADISTGHDPSTAG